MGGDRRGDQVLLFEEESYDRGALADFLRVCGMEVTLCEQPAAVVKFAGSMERHSAQLLVMHLGDASQLGMVLIEKIRLIRTVPLDRVFVLVDRSGPNTLEKIKQHGYLNVLDGAATPYELAKALNRALYQEKNARRLVRVFVRLRGELTLRAHKARVWFTNLSEGGAFAECDHVLPKGTEFDVRIDLGGGREILGKGVVIYTLRKTNDEQVVLKKGMGLKFTHLAESSRTPLEDFLKEELARAYAAGT